MDTTNSYKSILIETSNGNTYWIPDVDDSVRPVVGSVFKTLEEGIEKYRKYAYEAGFGSKLSTSRKNKYGLVIEKVMKCNKDGNPQVAVNIYKADTKKTNKQQRVASLQGTGCKAQIVFKIYADGPSFKIHSIDENHNHEMNSTAHKHLSKRDTRMQITEMMFVNRVSTSNIGPTKAHHILSNIQGSHKNTHGTVEHFKNYKKSINNFICPSDTQMLINKMENRKLCVNSFSFEVRVTGKDLAGMFWADETAKGNYRAFGDIISFDATYRTNR